MKVFYVDETSTPKQEFEGGHTIELISEKTVGARNKFRVGTIVYKDYHYSGRHDVQEAIYILEGSGTAVVGDAEIEIFPGRVLYIPAGEEHYIKEVKDKEIKALLIHSI